MTAAIRYGAATFTLDPRALDGRDVSVLATPRAGGASAGDGGVRRALDAPVGRTLRALAEGASSAAILIPGIDRVAGVGRYVPEILLELEAARVPRERTTLHLATGTHRHGGVDDLRALLGDALAARVRFVAHDPDDEGALVDLGETSRGTRVRIERAVAEADVKVLTGRVIPHYFAGFGGGRKALVPGVAGRATILHNHRLTLAPGRGIAANVAPCSLEGNPVHLDMLEASRLARPTFALSTLLDARHDLVDVVAGDPEASHAEACRRAQGLHQVRAAKPFDALVTSAGGAPYDCSFVQALKAIFDVEELVAPGGAVLWIAECPEGILPAFLEWAKIEDDEAFESEARARYNLAAHNTVLLRRFLRRARLALVSGLDPSAVRALGVEPLPSVAAGLAWLAAATPPGARVGVVPFANVTHGVVRGADAAPRVVKEGP